MAWSGNSTSKIAVWWDIENCQVPKDVDPHNIAQNLKSALHHANLNGPITIDVFGDTRNFEHRTLEALSSTGITINHIPSGNKDAADKAILVAMLFWALDNPPPAHFLLISGDGDFANALHRLRLKGYDILLARPDQQVKLALLGAATSVWYWKNIAKGQIPMTEAAKRGYEELSESQDKSLPSRIFEEPTDADTKELNMKNTFSALAQDLKNTGKFTSSKLPKPHHDPPVISTSQKTGEFKASSTKPIAPDHRRTLKKLKNWLLQLPSLKQGYDISSIKRDFQEATGIPLDPESLGYAKMKDMLNDFSVFRMHCPRKGVYLLFSKASSTKPIAPDHRRTLKKLKNWLLQLPSLNQGYDISLIKRDFQEATGIPLDPESLGYAKVKDILNDFSEDFCMQCPRKGVYLLFSNRKKEDTM